MSPESTQEAFERGTAAGGIATRLASHDLQLAKINGSMDKVGTALAGLTLAVQRLGDDAKARDATVLATAAALKAAEEARRDKTEHAWSPLARATAMIATFTTVAGFITWLTSR